MFQRYVDAVYNLRDKTEEGIRTERKEMGKPLSDLRDIFLKFEFAPLMKLNLRISEFFYKLSIEGIAELIGRIKSGSLSPEDLTEEELKKEYSELEKRIRVFPKALDYLSNPNKVIKYIKKSNMDVNEWFKRDAEPNLEDMFIEIEKKAFHYSLGLFMAKTIFYYEMLNKKKSVDDVLKNLIKLKHYPFADTYAELSTKGGLKPLISGKSGKGIYDHKRTKEQLNKFYVGIREYLLKRE